MAKLPIHGVHAPGLTLFLIFLQYPPLLLALSSSCTIQTKHFINCGSSNSVNYFTRDFVGDTSSDSVSFSEQNTSTQSSDQLSSVSAIYDTARIFRSPSSQYVLDRTGKGTHIVRLHFFPFGSSSNLSEALFNVSVKGLTLLSNFQVPSSTDSPVVEEFFLSISRARLVLRFSPQGSSFAFINALEVFLVPDGLAPYYAPNLRTTYRINVGGGEVTLANDSLWRSWDPDDDYIHVPNAAQNSSSYESALHYQDDLDKCLASELVYQTAKVMSVNFTNGQLYRNTTWSFKVSTNARHLVRAHFCDFVSPSLNTVYFNLYSYDNFSELIDPYGKKVFRQRLVPFHYDLLVKPGSSGLVKVSIGLLNTSMYQQAYLNGLEIMVIIGSKDSEDDNQNKHVSLMIGLVSGSIALLCIFGSAAIFGCKYRKPKRADMSVWTPSPAFRGGSKPTEQTSHGSVASNFHLGLTIPLAEIHFATNNFDGKLLIGSGGFGNVYRGTLRDGTKVAVKRSKPESEQGFSEFQTEITVLSKIRHRHLVSLIGYCAERSEMLLVYEFMEKGSLRDHLYNSDFPFLPWNQRLEICIGAARGLNYLHKGVAGGIIHRDIKSTNILLDENYVAKVADFGLSKLGPLDQSQTHVSTAVKGTFGYLDPEYFKTQQLTEKSDVYSFGVVLLEVLCARPSIDPSLPREQANLAEWGITFIKSGNIEQIVDPVLAGQINPNSLRKYGEVAEKCLQEEDKERPSMRDVLLDLEYALQLQQTTAGMDICEMSISEIFPR
ncbi:probable receptor-like protein kinase At2g23200 isoform X2 [Rhodamnia argentea]|uniref:Probable receptor-like protein kinase At2g23200 isoform X2 n=1 Tax=Rhodamnia argentea TaxID=178133 RepID=A0A8B8PBI3_9MYRT|nr:probable receptor-like protein kinase At2g23200 isoform X3 [Rhodamnia argentea]XP_030532015.1 probable receptor-like protein kinase At2g23200 isoform X2 [Rhodamnia argentea]